ncbi:hypothetical protein [Streptomyces sp. NPDC004528]|uniref:DUF6932 family protein n=1 Tax=Streptomyces sp. NPDC004528 TaxID=3154550 RepID=UPI0033A4D3DC
MSPAAHDVITLRNALFKARLGEVYGGHSLIPPLTSGGMLPVGRHPASLDEIRDLFVTQAPHMARRVLIYSALELYVSLMRELVPRATLWVDGGFCTHKSAVPKDVDLVVLAQGRDLEHFGDEEWGRMRQLLTLQDVEADIIPTAEPRVQPMGGLVDASLADADSPEEREFFDELWSSVKGPDGKTVPGARKGYLEVSL